MVYRVKAAYRLISINHLLLFIDGVFSPKSNGQLRFHRVNARTSKELNALVATISERVVRYLERRGRLARGARPGLAGLQTSCSDHLTLALDDEEGNTMQQLLRPLDYVSDSSGPAGSAQSADVTNCDHQDPVSPGGQRGFTGVSDMSPWSTRAAASGLLGS